MPTGIEELGMISLLIGMGIAVAGDYIIEMVEPDPDIPKPPPDVPKPSTTYLNETFNFLIEETFNTPTITPEIRPIYIPEGNKKQPNLPNIPNPPAVPNRRLPKEADGQNDTLTKRQKSISVAKAATDMKLGGLLHSPISKKELEIRQANSPDLNKVLADANKKSAENFALWLAQQSGTLTEEDELKIEKLGGSVPIWDCAALVTPQFLSGFEGEIGLLIGLEGLHAIASEFRNQRYNAFLPVTGIIPKKYKIKTFTPKNKRTYKEGKTDYAALSNSALSGVAKVLGVDEFPVTVPKSLIGHKPEELNKIYDSQIEALKAEKGRVNSKKLKKIFDKAIKEIEEMKVTELKLMGQEGVEPPTLSYFGDESYTTLKNLPQQNSWIVKVLDELLGNFPISIKIQDSDLLKVGDQTQTMRLPNIAETLAEQMGILMLTQTQLDLISNTVVRGLLETGQAKKLSLLNYYLLDCLRDYAGFKTKENIIEMEYSYNPFASDKEKEFEDKENGKGVTKQEEDPDWEKKSFSERLLTPKNVKIAVEEIDQKENLVNDLLKLRESYSIIKAALTRPVKDEQQLRKHFENLAKAMEDEPDKSNKDEFDRFLDKAELGFTQDGTTSHPDQPYGRPYDQRPQIKRLTKKNRKEK